jgi:iron complex transport system permease protein
MKLSEDRFIENSNSRIVDPEIQHCVENRLSDNDTRERFEAWKSNRGVNIVLFVMFMATVSVFIVSFAFGRYMVPVSQILQIFYAKLLGHASGLPEAVETVVLNIRSPRIVAAMLIGGALSVSGATYQGLFKNPMVSPDILGASAGAGFGAALGILLSFGMAEIQAISFLFGLAAVLLTMAVGSAVGRGNNSVLTLVLTGLVMSGLFSSCISMAKFMADPLNKLPAITFWLMGGLSSVAMPDVKVLIIPVMIGVIPLMLLRWRMNVLAFGEEEARALGVETSKLRIALIICSTLLTASSVSICGMIGWIGLVVPHFARMIVGPNFKALLPASFMIGSIFLVAVDDMARSAFALEIPLGVLTSFVGAPFFLYLLLKGKKGWV